MKRVFLLGDSTCAHKKKEAYPETGWGDAFSSFLSPEWSVDNRALNGRSTKSFIAEGEFKRVLDDASSGDVAIIQFGHNDSKQDPTRFSPPFTGYVENLVYMAKELKKKGVLVYFATSIARRQFGDDGILKQTHGMYPAAMIYASFLSSVPVIDMTIRTMVEMQNLGVDSTRRLFMNLDKGEYENYPDGKIDNTHLTPTGAKWIASIVFDELSHLEPRPDFIIPKAQSASVDIDYDSLEVVD